jgi:hypothetical protein
VGGAGGGEGRTGREREREATRLGHVRAFLRLYAADVALKEAGEATWRCALGLALSGLTNLTRYRPI